MISDQQYRSLKKHMQTEATQSLAAAKAGMDEKTARKYVQAGKGPSEMKRVHTWRTREDGFKVVWAEVRKEMELNPGLEAKTVFEEMQRRYPGEFSDGQLRTLQRRIKQWRALEGPSQEIYFAQEYLPGAMCQSDFTHMKELGVTIGGEQFNHLFYHLVLPYSNWETGTLCFSESFESLSEGLQNALWELGGVPAIHQTDRLTAAVHKTTNPEEFTQRYSALLRHYGLRGKKINVNCPNENGDVEQRHHRFKRALDQALMLRGSRDFTDRVTYGTFVAALFGQLNRNRTKRFQEELGMFHGLPAKPLEATKRQSVRVGPSSTIRVNHNTYSVNSRLIGEMVEVHLHAEQVEVYYAQQCVERFPRLRGEGGHRIQYRHIIDWLVRKPGAFENYRFRDDLFPTHRFRVAYDQLKERAEVKSYLEILQLAAEDGEAIVDGALQRVIDVGTPISIEVVRKDVEAQQHQFKAPREVTVSPVDLFVYDTLLHSVMECV